MEAWTLAWVQTLLGALALPQYGLAAVFIVSLVSATLLPLASEPVVFGLVKLNPSMFWPTLVVATAGNTIGGAITWWMGYGAERAYEQLEHRPPKEHRALRMVQRYGAPACLLAWLPVIGDPLCAVAGWLRLAFWPCVGWMALGKFLRYLALTGSALWLFPGRFTG